MGAELEATNRDVNPPNPNAESVDIDPSAVAIHRAALEMYAFLLLWIVGVAEKVGNADEDGAATNASKGKRATGKSTKAGTSGKAAKKKTSSWLWVDQIPLVLSLLGKTLKTLQTGRIWTSTAERDGFIGYLYHHPRFIHVY
jgi:condensin complex subunit 1